MVSSSAGIVMAVVAMSLGRFDRRGVATGGLGSLSVDGGRDTESGSGDLCSSWLS